MSRTVRLLVRETGCKAGCSRLYTGSPGTDSILGPLAQGEPQQRPAQNAPNEGFSNGGVLCDPFAKSLVEGDQRASREAPAVCEPAAIRT